MFPLMSLPDIWIQLSTAIAIEEFFFRLEASDDGFRIYSAWQRHISACLFGFATYYNTIHAAEISKKRKNAQIKKFTS
jgi:hypothetical protein